MDTISRFGDSARGLSRNPLGIIALFIVLIYGFASLVVGFSDKLQPSERTPIIWFLVLSPLVVLAVFGWLVSRHHEKLYAPKDYTDDESFLKSLPNRNKAREDIDKLDEKIGTRIYNAITSADNVNKLKRPHDNIENILENIANITSKEVLASAFLTIDATEFVDNGKFVFSFPTSAFSTLNELIDEIYFKLAKYVEVYTYGYLWVLEDAKSGKVIRNARMITNAGPGSRVTDIRSLSDVGIGDGARLIVRKPKST